MAEKYRLRSLENLVLIEVTKMKLVILPYYSDEIQYSCTKKLSQTCVGQSDHRIF